MMSNLTSQTTKTSFIPFTQPFITGNEQEYIQAAIEKREIASDGHYTRACESLLEDTFSLKRALFVTSCTSALEMAAMLCDLQPDDEVIMPAYTFVSTANAFVREKAKPVFVDIRKDTLNLDETLLKKAITNKTKAIVPVHYAGMPCNMDEIMSIASTYNLIVIEDAAQAVHSHLNGQALGSIGHLGTYSFHETKNYVCGEGGALCINEDRFLDRAEILREKGTNRKQFMLGTVDKYTWVDKGSSFVNSEISAAFLYAQLQALDLIREKRKTLWNLYYSSLLSLQDSGDLLLPMIPGGCDPNYHMFQILLPNLESRNHLMSTLRKDGIHAVFHYVPLHTSPMGSSLGYTQGMLPVTEEYSARVLRLPLYADLSIESQAKIIQSIISFF